jgi:hypothetical protein
MKTEAEFVEWKRKQNFFLSKSENRTLWLEMDFFSWNKNGICRTEMEENELFFSWNGNEILPNENETILAKTKIEWRFPAEKKTENGISVSHFCLRVVVACSSHEV